MRLLNVITLKLETFNGPDVPKYAALSHTWGDEEVTFQDIMAGSGVGKIGWIKIIRSAAEAEKHGCKYIWIDTCCIDKTSSAELSEAINSMFRWYRKCQICFAHLDGVKLAPKTLVIVLEVDSEPITPGASPITQPPSPRSTPSSFSKARWFERGWTLQELIAPSTLYFYDSGWAQIGEKKELSKEISDITGIDTDVICDRTFLYTKSIAQKMSWASRRETTKIEDLAYCLMGIFGVNMPLLYGEGERAYARLQGEIMKRTYDHSLFAWNYNFPTTAYGSSNRLLERPPQGIGVLAPHPSAFSGCADIIPYTTKTEPYVTTNRGIQIHLRVLRHSLSAKPHTRLAILQCRYRSNLSTAMAIPIKPVYRSRHLESEVEYYRSADEDLVNLEYSLAAESSSQNIYLHEAEPFWQSEPQNLYRCCLHKYGKELGVQFHKALYCQYPIVTSTVTGSIVKQWNYKDNSAIWGDDRRGIRAALYFAKSNGPAFVVVLTLMHLSTKRGYPSMHIYIRTVHEKIEGPKSTVLSQVSLRKVLEEETPFELAQELDEIQTTFPFESRVMTVQVKREIIHEEIVFILDIFFSGVKRSHSESNRTP